MKNKTNIFMFLLGVLCSTLVLIGVYTFFRYSDNISAAKPISLSYNQTHMFCSLSADYCSRLTTPKRTLYLCKLPQDSQPIEMIIPSKVTITVYPNDDDSVFIKYAPHKWGITRNYKLSGYGDFNKHLEILYEITENEAFNQVIDLPEANP